MHDIHIRSLVLSVEGNFRTSLGHLCKDTHLGSGTSLLRMEPIPSIPTTCLVLHFLPVL